MHEQSIFIAALDREDPAERAAYVERVCAGDPALRQRMERLLYRHQQADSFLAAPAVAPAATVDEPRTVRPSTVIGPYKLLQQIGEGGMGVVYMAEQQEPVRRKVALKIINKREVIIVPWERAHRAAGPRSPSGETPSYQPDRFP
jgi:serine/threonine protein kinase